MPKKRFAEGEYRIAGRGCPTLGLFQGWYVNLEKRRASSYFRGEYRGLVEILVSYLSAKNAERWGTLHFWRG
jgi:hypothetical protein